MGTKASTKPLAGVKVLDLTNVLAGPFACHQLAHLGADVLKIETVGRGDLARNLGADPVLSARGMGVSFLAQNAGKRSMTLNLKSVAGKQILKTLVGRSNVLVENFRPGVMDRLRLGSQTIRAENPELIYCAISGFGQDGPWAHQPAYDQIVQGISGVMSVTGDSDSAPLRVGYPLADTIGGLTAAMMICAALQSSERGCFIDVSMLDSVLATMGWVVSNHLIAGVDPSPHGNENPTSAPSGTFQCADGLINIAANKDEQWIALASHLGRSDLLSDPIYATREDRKANRFRLRAELETVLTQRNADVWVRALNEIGVPAGPVLSVPEILAHPQVRGRDLLALFENVRGLDRSLELMRVGAMVDGERPRVEAPPPTLGQDTDDVLRSLGYSSVEIARLRKEAVV
ncbi:MAG: CoA transferase [Pseudomonadota bacterium]